MDKQPVLCAVGSENLYSLSYTNSRLALPCLRQLVAGLSLRRPGFEPGLFYVRFVVDKVALEQVFIQAFRFSLVYIIPKMLHTHLHLHVAITRRTNG
jgi:hypothetical protein